MAVTPKRPPARTAMPPTVPPWPTPSVQPLPGTAYNVGIRDKSGEEWDAKLVAAPAKYDQQAAYAALSYAGRHRLPGHWHRSHRLEGALAYKLRERLRPDGPVEQAEGGAGWQGRLRLPSTTTPWGAQYKFNRTQVIGEYRINNSDSKGQRVPTRMTSSWRPATTKSATT